MGERKELTVIPTKSYRELDRRPPKGVRIHNRLAKAANPDTPFHKVLVLQEQLRAKQIQEEKDRQEVERSKVETRAREEAIERVRRENEGRAEEERKANEKEKETEKVFKRRNELENGIRAFRNGWMDEIIPQTEYECAEWIVEKAFLDFKLGWVSTRGVVQSLTGNIRVDDDPIDVIGIRNRILTPEEIARFEDQSLRLNFKF